MQPIGTHGSEVMYVGCVCFRGELGFLNYDICMCVVNRQFEPLEFVFDSVDVDLCIMMRFLSFILLGMCPCGVSVVMWLSLVCL